MKTWQLLIVTSATAAFLWLAVYAHHHRHDDEHGYSKAAQAAAQAKISQALEAPAPAILQLFADDGEPVNRRIKAREWHAARRDLGKE